MSVHRGGGKFGKVQNSWPFVKLTITNDGISMKTILQKVEMKRESIQEVILQRNVLNWRFIFVHNNPAISKVIEFWTFSPDKIATALKSQGYAVSEGT
jgi:hypothetical protein